MAAESATTETVEKKESGEDNSVKLKENGQVSIDFSLKILKNIYFWKVLENFRI